MKNNTYDSDLWGYKNVHPQQRWILISLKENTGNFQLGHGAFLILIIF